ncbi:hypothetical protein ABK040_011798 [Willaertia magna]
MITSATTSSSAHHHPTNMLINHNSNHHPTTTNTTTNTSNNPRNTIQIHHLSTIINNNQQQQHNKYDHLFHSFFYLKYSNNLLDTLQNKFELIFDYPLNTYSTFNITMYLSKNINITNYSNVLTLKYQDYYLYYKYINNIGIIGIITKYEYYSLYSNILLTIYSRMIINRDDINNILIPYIEYIYDYQPYPKYGEKFQIRYPTKNIYLDGTHYFKRPNIDEYIPINEISIKELFLKLKTIDHLIILFKYILFNKKIIIYSKNNYNDIFNIIYTLLQLIYPFKYLGDILPYLDNYNQLKYECQFNKNSFIIGYIHEELPNIDNDDILILDLDHLHFYNFNNFIELPKELILKNNLEKNKLNIEKIVNLFIKYFIYLFGNYRYYYKLNNTTQLLEFDKLHFLKDFNNNNFYKLFLETNSFNYFLKERNILINNYSSFQLQKLQFGKFENNCYKNNPRIYNTVVKSLKVNNTITTTTTNTVTNNNSITTNNSNNNNALNNNYKNTFSLKQLFFKKRANSDSIPHNTSTTTSTTTTTSSSSSSSTLSNSSNNNINIINEHYFNNENNLEIMNSNMKLNNELINNNIKVNTSSNNNNNNNATASTSSIINNNNNQLPFYYYMKEDDDFNMKQRISFFEHHELLKPSRKYLPTSPSTTIINNNNTTITPISSNTSISSILEQSTSPTSSVNGGLNSVGSSGSFNETTLLTL